MIVNVGEAHIVVNLLQRGEESEEVVGNTADDEGARSGAKLKLKIFGGPTSGEIL